MRYSKGSADYIGYVFLWILSIMLGAGLALVLSLTGAADDVMELRAELDYVASQQEGYSVISTVMHGEVSGLHEYEQEADYGEKTFSQVLSLYLSSEEEIVIDGETIDLEIVENDLNLYMEELSSIYPVVKYSLRVDYGDEEKWIGGFEGQEFLASYQLKTEKDTARVVLVEGDA